MYRANHDFLIEKNGIFFYFYKKTVQLWKVLLSFFFTLIECHANFTDLWHVASKNEVRSTESTYFHEAESYG